MSDRGAVALRPLHDADEIAAGFDVFLRAMVGLATEGAPPPSAFIEPGRPLGAFADGRIVGVADSFRAALTVPGGARLPHAAVTRVGVLPTHTRRGLLSALMAEQLRRFAAEGVVLASLRASEGGIYGRFGYGIATRAATVRIDRRSARLLPAPAPAPATVPESGPASGGIRLLGAPEDAAPLLAPIHARGSHVGSLERPASWWRLHQPPITMHDARPYLVVHGEPGAEDGYLLYRPADRADWFGSDARTVVVEELVAHSDAAWRALVAHLLALDFVETVELPGRPLDEPLPLLLADPRAAATSAVADETWLRLVDVDRALRARTWGETAGSVVIEVTDPLLAANAGRWQIAADGARRCKALPQLTAPSDALASAYLGDARWWQLVTAGRASAADPAAITTADRLFATARLPWSGTFF